MNTSIILGNSQLYYSTYYNEYIMNQLSLMYGYEFTRIFHENCAILGGSFITSILTNIFWGDQDIDIYINSNVLDLYAINCLGGIKSKNNVSLKINDTVIECNKYLIPESSGYKIPPINIIRIDLQLKDALMNYIWCFTDLTITTSVYDGSGCYIHPDVYEWKMSSINYYPTQNIESYNDKRKKRIIKYYNRGFQIENTNLTLQEKDFKQKIKPDKDNLIRMNIYKIIFIIQLNENINFKKFMPFDVLIKKKKMYFRETKETTETKDNKITFEKYPQLEKWVEEYEAWKINNQTLISQWTLNKNKKF